MSAVRVTAMLCITVLVIITGVVVHSNNQERYVILPQNNSMFIFDRKTAAVNYCTADQCKLVMPFGGASMPGANPGMMMSGMGIPQGFQPYINPGNSNTSGMMISTSMNNPMMMGNNNPMMMWAYMQAAQAAETSAQKGGFSSLQSQPTWMNMMSMMQPTAMKNGAVLAQSPIIPVAMTTGDTNKTDKTKDGPQAEKKPKKAKKSEAKRKAAKAAKEDTQNDQSGGDEENSDDDSANASPDEGDDANADDGSSDNSDENSDEGSSDDDSGGGGEDEGNDSGDEE